jgi:small subunit ribosomal protein S20
MPIIKSAKKRVRVAKKAAVRNSKTKRSLKGALKAFHRTVIGSDKKKTASAQSSAQSALDKAAKKNVIHKNKAARQKRQLAAKAKAAAGVEKKAAPAKKAAAPKKAAAKPAAKKAVAKKPAAKKTTPKK